MNKKKLRCVLVTGSTGFLGCSIVRTLVAEGFKVRAFVRVTSKSENLEGTGAELCIGDMVDFDSLKLAFDGVDYVVHCAADTAGTVNGGKTCTVQGTKNVLSLCQYFKIKKLVYISSCNIYGIAGLKDGDLITEESPLEPKPEARGPYSYAKFQAEQYIRHAAEANIFPIVCLRPGTIFGPGGTIYSPMIGLSFGRKFFLAIGDGELVLPLAYVENVADAVRVVLEKDESNNKIYNVIDPYQLTKREYIEQLLKKIYHTAQFIYLPYSILYAIVCLQEIMFTAIGKEPFLTRYRLASSQRKIVYDGSKIRRELNWTPPISGQDALQNIIEYNAQNP